MPPPAGKRYTYDLSHDAKSGGILLRHRLEYHSVRAIVAVLGRLPRSVARHLGSALGRLLFKLSPKLRQTGQQNLTIAYPSMAADDRSALLRNAFQHLGRHLAEVCLMTRYTESFAQAHVMRYEGLQHFLNAQQAGKGVLVLTGHLGAWELSSFLHSLLGQPMGIVIRRLDNPLLDRFVNGIRCKHGNRILHKDDFARGLLRAMARGETVGILMDTNMTPPQGVFVPFFGVEACTASGLARVARKTGAAVLPGFLVWDENEDRYILRFGECLALQHTDDAEQDALHNTALFAQVTEQYIRQYPEQWLWLHRRWKTRPAGEPSLYTRQHAS